MIIPIFIHIPIPFPYERTKMLSWNYDLTIHISRNEENLVEMKLKPRKLKSQISKGASGITKSGRVYIHGQLITKKTHSVL